MSEPLDERGLGDYIERRFRSPGDTLFRMETLPGYEVRADGEDYRRWRSGAREPTWSRKQPWLDALHRERENGQISRRVRLLSEGITDYERYACEFGYVYNVGAGEDIRILHIGEHPVPNELAHRDFWIVNDIAAVLMDYDERGRFVRAVAVPDALAELRHLRDAAWSAAEPFEQWWGRHPELRRS